MIRNIAVILSMLAPGWISAEATPKDPAPPQQTQQFAKHIAVPGIENFASLTPRISRGGQPTREGYRALKKRGFKTVVSLREHHDERKLVEAAGLKWVHIPLHADITGSRPPDEKEIHNFFDAVLDPDNQPVYFHCALGKDRTGTMAALYRMEVDGWTADKALREMDAFGAHGIYKSLHEFVKNYKPGHIHISVKPKS